MNKETVILILLVAMIIVSVMQGFQMIAFSNVVASLKAVGGTAVSATSAGSSAAPASSGVGGC